MVKKTPEQENSKPKRQYVRRAQANLDSDQAGAPKAPVMYVVNPTPALKRRPKAVPYIRPPYSVVSLHWRRGATMTKTFSTLDEANAYLADVIGPESFWWWHELRFERDVIQSTRALPSLTRKIG